MATEAVGRRSHGLPSGLGGVLAALLADPEVAKAQQRANDPDLLRRLQKAWVRGQLRSQDVEKAQGTPQGKTLAQHGPGRAALSVFLAVALAEERQFGRVAQVLGPAEQDPRTKASAAAASAAALKARAFEELGEEASADVCINALEKDQAYRWLTPLFQNLEIVSANRGVMAVAAGDSRQFEASALRFLAIHHRSVEQGFQHPMDSTLNAFRLNLQGQHEEAFQALWSYGYDQPSPDERENWLTRAPMERERLLEEADGQALEALEEFAELVRLLAIEDPFERWDELARVISADWPEGLSKEDAVSQGRE